MLPMALKPKTIKIRNRVFDWSHTYVMGVLNITPDSFSDGGRYLKTEDALKQAIHLVNGGADILDIGGESSRPFSKPVSVDEEIARTLPVIKAIRKQGIEIPISIDTTKSQVAEQALMAGADIINDISAMRFDPDMAGLAADLNAPVVLMHMKGSPRDMQISPDYKGDVVKEIKRFLEDRIKHACDSGIKQENIIIDPGIGFGKTFDHNLEILNRLEELVAIGQPVLIGASRKAFLGAITGIESPADRDVATLGITSICAMKGIHIVRVHQTKKTCQILKVMEAVQQQHI